MKFSNHNAVAVADKNRVSLFFGVFGVEHQHEDIIPVNVHSTGFKEIAVLLQRFVAEAQVNTLQNAFHGVVNHADIAPHDSGHGDALRGNLFGLVALGSQSVGFDVRDV